MEVRRPIAADMPALAQLMSELGYPTSLEEIAERMEAIRDRSDYETYVAELDGMVVGMIGVSVSPSLLRSDANGAIVALVVSSNFRGRGIARLLMEHGEEWMRQRGAHHASVHPSLRREAAHQMYNRLGYEHTGLRLTKMLAGD